MVLHPFAYESGEEKEHQCGYENSDSLHDEAETVDCGNQKVSFNE